MNSVVTVRWPTRNWRRNSSAFDRRATAAARNRSFAISRRYRERFQAIERIDFFGSAGRDRVASLLAALESKHAGTPDQRAAGGGADVAQYNGRLWVTRPRPGVDRMSSAWLIRRFIDATATFGFVTDAKNAPADAVAFDMYGTGFGHEGDRCTFETLVAKFGIQDRAVTRLSEVVHNLDLKDGSSPRPKPLPSAPQSTAYRCRAQMITSCLTKASSCSKRCTVHFHSRRAHRARGPSRR